MATEPICGLGGNGKRLTLLEGVESLVGGLGEDGPGSVCCHSWLPAHDVPPGRGLPGSEELMDTHTLPFLFFIHSLLSAILFVCSPPHLLFLLLMVPTSKANGLKWKPLLPSDGVLL